MNFMQADSRFEGLVIDLGRAAHTVTKALDYVGVDDHSHGRRVGIICHRIAHFMGWDRHQRHFSLLAGMLHDCGVSSTAMHKKLVGEMEWDGATEHCVRGEFFLNSFPPFAPYAEAVRYHHSRWEELPDDMDEQTKLFSNLIFFADRLDVAYSLFVLANPTYQVLHEKELILSELTPYVGSLFSPLIYDAAKKAILKDSFWLELQDEFLDEAIFETLEFGDHSVPIGFDEIEALGELISQIVDAKSPFTHYHSLRVADLAYTVSGFMGFEEQKRRILRIAGLLHDVGKLRTPDEVLEKPGKLTADEEAMMHRHPMDSKLVLNAIFPDTPIGRWASQHHEKLNGSGYPYGWPADQIEPETRILTICDIFQALCQKRPYRDRLNVEDVVGIMSRMEQAGEIDPDIFNLVLANQSELYKIAIREGTD